MPLWTIYHPRSTFTSEDEKSSLAQAITSSTFSIITYINKFRLTHEVYTAVPLPAFYVNVLFVPLDPTNIYIGGVARPSPHSAAHEPGPNSSVPFIRLTIQHIARTLYAA